MTVSEALELIAQRRDIHQAFEVLVEEYKGNLYSFLRHHCHNSADAEELTQVTFIAAFKHILKFDPGRASFLTWLCEIGERNWLAMVRARCREREWMRTWRICGPVSAPGPDVDMVKKARAEAVWAMLARLELYDQVVCVLYLMEGKSYEQIGRELGMPVRTVKMHSLRARHLLRMQMLMTPIPRYEFLTKEARWTG